MAPAERYRELAFAGLYFCLGLLAAASLFWPHGHDQGSFATGGKILLDGGTPYIDVWEQKGPACHVTYALAHLLFGRNMWGIRVLDLVALAGTAMAIWQFLRRNGDRTAAHAGTLCFCFSYLNLGFWHTAQPDGWAGMAVIAALVFLSEPKPHAWGRPVLAGALVGLATQYKFLYAPFLCPLLLAAALAPSLTAGGRLKNASRLAAGFVLVNAAFLGWLASRHALAEHADITFGFNRSVHLLMQQANLLNRDLESFHRYFLKPFAYSLPLAALGVIDGLRRCRTFAGPALLAWLLALAMVIVQRTYHALYHWIPLIGLTAVLLGLGLAALPRLLTRAGSAISQGTGTAWTISIGLFLALLTGYPGYRPVFEAIWYASGDVTADQYYNRFGEYGVGTYCGLANLQVAAHIRQHAREGDQLLIWGFEPGIYYLSGRRPSTRFIVNYPLVAATRGGYRDRYRREFIRELKRNRPLHVIVVDHDNNHLLPVTSRESFHRFSRFKEIVLRDYFLEARIEHFAIFRRRHGTPPLVSQDTMGGTGRSGQAASSAALGGKERT